MKRLSSSGAEDTPQLTTEQIIAIIQNITATKTSIEAVNKELGEMNARLKEGDKAFNLITAEVQALKTECIRRAATCPTFASLGNRLQNPTAKDSLLFSEGIPWKFALTGLAAIGLSIWGLVQIIAKLLGVNTSWP